MIHKAMHTTPSIPTTRSKAKIILSVVSLVGLAAASVLISGVVRYVPDQKTVQLPPQPGYYAVTYVHDGDTISVKMDGREEKVRMIGVDTPETIKPNSPVECYGVAASNYLKKLLSNQTVRLEADPINQNRDRYDRLLRYVYTQDNLLVNKAIVEQGYGFAYLSFPFSKAEEFRLAQVDARTNNRGVWSGECTITNPESDRPKSNILP
jgi:micrococcal nuclease